MVNKIIIGGLIALFIGGMTFMANADHMPYNENVNYKDVTCATLAYNAGYDELGKKFADRVEPYYHENKDTIVAFSKEVVDTLARDAQLTDDGTLAESARYFFNQYCQEA
jgi:hypothetical protein